MTDDRLAARAAEGDRAAFALIFERHHQGLYRYCRAILRHDEDARDALQTTFTRAIAALDGEQRSIAIRPWLYRIAHNEAISLARRRRPYVPLESSTGELPTSPEPHQELMAGERMQMLIADLQSLPDRQRSALLMRELNELPYGEIGAALETSEQAARQSVYEARVMLVELKQGREMDCEDVRRLISERDGRLLRPRRVRAHIRACTGCREFRGSIDSRRAELGVLAPPLSASAAAALLGSILGGGGGGFGGGGLIGALTGVGQSITASVSSKGLAAAAAVTIAGSAFVANDYILVPPRHRHADRIVHEAPLRSDAPAGPHGRLVSPPWSSPGLASPEHGGDVAEADPSPASAKSAPAQPEAVAPNSTAPPAASVQPATGSETAATDGHPVAGSGDDSPAAASGGSSSGNAGAAIASPDAQAAASDAAATPGNDNRHDESGSPGPGQPGNGSGKKNGKDETKADAASAGSAGSGGQAHDDKAPGLTEAGQDSSHENEGHEHGQAKGNDEPTGDADTHGKSADHGNADKHDDASDDHGNADKQDKPKDDNSAADKHDDASDDHGNADKQDKPKDDNSAADKHDDAKDDHGNADKQDKPKDDNSAADKHDDASDDHGNADKQDKPKDDNSAADKHDDAKDDHGNADKQDKPKDDNAAADKHDQAGGSDAGTQAASADAHGPVAGGGKPASGKPAAHHS